MCTITYLPNLKNKTDFIVTDNRDEAVNRPAEFPKTYKEYNTELFYPQDTRAKGTWFGVSRKKQLMALMNGAFKRHERKISYAKSRGVVVKDLIASDDIIKAAENYDFTGIEAFFGIVFSWKEKREVFEIIWDEKQLYINQKDADQPKIWSAAMTYSEEQHQKRINYFETFLKENANQQELIADLVWDFHHRKGDDQEEGMIIDRGFLKTTSISQFSRYADGEKYFHYKDLISGKEQENEIIWST